MDRAELEKKLENGEQWGFRKLTSNPDHLGWILISKRKPYIPSPKETYTHEELYLLNVKNSQAVREYPYHVLVIEVRRDTHESGQHESEADYQKRDNYYYSSLDEVEKLINQLGHHLEDIKWRAELDAP